MGQRTMLVPIDVRRLLAWGQYREIKKGSDSFKPYLTSLWVDTDGKYYLGESFVDSFDDETPRALRSISRRKAHDWLLARHVGAVGGWPEVADIIQEHFPDL